VAGLIYRGQILNQQRRLNEAIPALEAALKTEPDNAAAHYHLGVSFSQAGNLGRAESEWREAVRLHPSMVEAQMALARVAQSKGDFDQLRARAEQLIGAEPAAPEGYILRATARVSLRDPVGGEADLHKAIELAPQNPTGYSRLGDLRFAQKRFNDAERLFEQALGWDPNFSEALQGLVGVYMQQKQSAKALARVNAQIAKAPDNSTYYLLSGTLLAGTKDLDKAEVALEKAVQLNKNNVDAFNLLGQVQLRRGSVDKAIASYQRSIQENPREVRTYVLLGALEESRDNWQKAQELYQNALKIEPEYPLAANNLAYLMLEHGGNTDVALSFAQVAHRKMPDSPNVADTLAWVYYHKAAYRLAIGLLEEAVKKLPQNATFHYHLGLAYQKANERSRAKVHLERALQIDPKYGYGAEIRKALAELSGD
jgi:tetratricopeptide (TPR) repeat protein